MTQINLTFPAQQAVVFGETNAGLTLSFSAPGDVSFSVLGIQGPAGGGGGGGLADGDYGDIIVSGGATALTVDANAITLSKMAQLTTSTILGRTTVGTGNVEPLTPAQVRTLLNVADGATANATDASLRDRATHTGTQAVGTVTGLAAVATSGSAADLGAGILPAARFDDTAHGARAGGTLHANVVAAGAAGFMTGADKTKLDGVATGATANATDASLRDRSTHTGTQAASTIGNFAASVIATVLLGFAAAGTRTTIVATDSILLAFGKVQKYLNDLAAIAFSGSVADLTGTKAQFNTAASDGDFLFVGDAPTAHTHVAANITDFSTAADARISAASINALADVIITAPSATQVLKYNGTNWINDTDATGGGGYTHPNHSGDVTSVGDGAQTIAADVVTNAKLANVATSTIKGRATAATGDPEDLTPAQVRTLINVADGAQVNVATDLAYTASTRILASSTGADVTLPLFTSTEAGLVPLSGGGTANFLRADGTFAAPAGGGDMVLASAQTNSALKTFLNGTFGLRNVANTFTALFTNAITAARTYTLKDADGTLAFTSDITGVNSGTNTGDQTITLTADVTGTGTGSFATTIAANAVTNTKLADMAANSFKINNTGAASDPIDGTVAQVKTLLAYTPADIGAATAAQANATHTGDATGATALTLATVNANVGSFGLAASVAQFTVNAKGLITAAANLAISIASTAISDSTAAGRAFLTAATAAAQTALLDPFTSALKGLVPASGGGTANFLRADGTWAAPGGGGGLTDGDKGDITVSSGGTVLTVDPNIKVALTLVLADGAFNL